MTKIILLEGLDDIASLSLMEKLTKEGTDKGYKCMSVMFPRYDELSGMMVKNHLKEFPKPDYDHEFEFNDLQYQCIKEGMLLFTRDLITSKMNVIEVKKLVYKGYFYGFVAVDCIDKTERLMTCLSCQNIRFYRAIINNIFDWNCKASHMTKAQLFTVDRNIWFTNNRKEIESCDYVFVNRSYLSNFLYRTVDMNDMDEFLEYVITIMNTEVNSLQLTNCEFIPIYIKGLYDPEYMVSFMETNAYEKGISREDVDRSLQYLKTIWNNYEHCNDLITKFVMRGGPIADKYSDLIQMKELMIYSDLYDVIVDQKSDRLIFDTFSKMF